MGLLSKIIKAGRRYTVGNPKIKDEYFVGKDRYGNRYFEYEERGIPKREVEYKKIQTHQGLGDSEFLPIEWRSWLSFIREQAPSKDVSEQLEIERAYRRQKAMEVEREEELQEMRESSGGYGHHLMNDEQTEGQPAVKPMHKMSIEEARQVNDQFVSPPSTQDNYVPAHLEDADDDFTDNSTAYLSGNTEEKSAPSAPNLPHNHFPKEKLLRDSPIDLPKSFTRDRTGTKKSHEETRDELRGFSNSRTSKYMGVRPQIRPEAYRKLKQKTEEEQF